MSIRVVLSTWVEMQFEPAAVGIPRRADVEILIQVALTQRTGKHLGGSSTDQFGFIGCLTALNQGMVDDDVSPSLILQEKDHVGNTIKQVLDKRDCAGRSEQFRMFHDNTYPLVCAF